MHLSALGITVLVVIVIIYSVLIFQKPCLHCDVVEGNHPVVGRSCLLAAVMQRGEKVQFQTTNVLWPFDIH